MDAGADALLRLRWLGPGAGDERLPALGQIPVFEADPRRFDARDAVHGRAPPAGLRRDAKRGVSPPLWRLCRRLSARLFRLLTAQSGDLSAPDPDRRAEPRAEDRDRKSTRLNSSH